MTTNPYTSQSSPDNMPNDGGGRRAARAIGTVLAGIGLLVLAYGAVAFWLVQSLPPNGGQNGRLPSVYVMGGGIFALLLGMVVRGLQLSRRTKPEDGSSEKRIPTSLGMLVILAIVIAIIIAIARS